MAEEPKSSRRKLKRCSKCGGGVHSNFDLCSKCKRVHPCTRCQRPTESKLDPPLCKACQSELFQKQINASIECPQCGKPKTPHYPLCWECNKPTWLKRGESKSNTPWVTPKWKERREQIIARTTKCERCGIVFSPQLPPVVNHLKTRYFSPDGKTDWDAYLAMNDNEVEVICNRCHWAFTRHGVYPGDPKIVCPVCQKPKAPKFKTCYECYRKSPESELDQSADKRMMAIHNALIEGANCTHNCEDVGFVEIGEEDDQVNTLPKCAIDELVRKHPNWFRIVG